MAIPKLNKVPIKIYSVSFLSFDDVKSANLKADILNYLSLSRYIYLSVFKQIKLHYIYE
jgi:hypothetical protein